MISGPEGNSTIEDWLSHATGLRWRIVDPFETQSKDFAGVPSVEGAYMWLRSEEPPFGSATRDVLLTGVSRNLRRRLYQLSRSDEATATDSVVQRVFDVVVAPAVRPEVLQDLVRERRSSGIARMWIRDHVMFAFAELPEPSTNREPDEGLIHFDDWTPGPAKSLGDLESVMIGTFLPWFNTNPRWNAVGETWHEHHDITLPIRPAPPEGHPAVS